jgi:hypothetical protein
LAVATVGWKLAQREAPQLSCVAEEIALRALVIEAEALMEARDWPAEDFGDFRQEVFEDFDVDYLFDPAFDGVAEGETAAQMGMASMAFEDWFKPFGGGSRGMPHPYSAED